MRSIISSLCIFSSICLTYSQDIYFDDVKEFDKCNSTTGINGECRFPKDCPRFSNGKIAGKTAKICGFAAGSSFLICCTEESAAVTRVIAAPNVRYECGIRGKRIEDRKIIGGKESVPFSWPWMVLLGKGKVNSNNKPPSFFCDGTLINRRFILTAAHCLLDPTDFFVRLGEHNYRTDDDGGLHQDVDVETIIWHPKHDFNLGYNDLALVKLAKDITFSKSARPICLPWDKYSNAQLVNSGVIVTGWGAEMFGGSLSPVLREVNVQIFSASECEEKYLVLDQFKSLFPNGMTTETIICAGDTLGGKDACQGDSGGPLVQYDRDLKRFFLAAVVSQGFGCGLKKFPGIYSPIRNQETLQWIKDKAFSSAGI